MRKTHLLALTLVLFGLSPSVLSATPDDVTPLNNKDVVVMVEHKVETEQIIKSIMSSPCTFDTFPPVLRELKRRGVPEAVLQVMLKAPYGPSLANNSRNDLGEQPIYHYAEQLKQMGLLIPVVSGRSLPTRQTRSAARSQRRP